MLVAALLLFSSSHHAACPVGQTKDEATLVRVEQAWVRAAEHQDTAGLECLLATEFEEADYDGSLISRSAMLASAAKPSSRAS